jgi:segregation and condensation protein A
VQDVEQPTATLGQFAIETEVFSGPLELLISLIEKRKLLVNDISIASVTDEYILHVAEMERCHLRETSQFVVLASTLLLIKSKSLLPVLQLTEEEEEDIDNLNERLRMYQIYRNAGKTIEEIFGKNISHDKRFVSEKKPLFITDTYTEKDVLREAMQNVLNNLPVKQQKPKVRVAKVVSLEEMIDRLRNKVERQFKFGFSDFTENSKEKGTVIVGFLAVLEMVKQGGVMVRQTSTYQEIEIERETSGAPRYI